MEVEESDWLNAICQCVLLIDLLRKMSQIISISLSNYKTPKYLICPGEKFNIFFAKPQIKKKIKAQKSFRLERSWNKNISADRRASTMIMIN